MVGECSTDHSVSAGASVTDISAMETHIVEYLRGFGVRVAIVLLRVEFIFLNGPRGVICKRVCYHAGAGGQSVPNATSRSVTILIILALRCRPEEPKDWNEPDAEVGGLAKKVKKLVSFERERVPRVTVCRVEQVLVNCHAE